LHPPLWTYQVCGGVTRLGDPQSFGLSPLFAPILVFGSFWGAKLLMLAATLLGFVYLRELLALVAGPSTGDARSRRILSSLSLLFFSGNYFLWHFNAGQMTFALIPFSMAFLYCGLRAWQGKWERRDFAVTAAFSYAFFSTGFYHAL